MHGDHEASGSAAPANGKRGGSKRPHSVRNAGKRSSLPSVLPHLTIDAPEALPEFFIPTLSTAAGKKDPVISMPHDTKFFLLSSLCDNGLLSTGGRVVHFDSDDSAQGLNKFISALLRGQKALLDFGFKSNIDSIKEMVHSFAEALDGRNDHQTKRDFFEPPEERYEEDGQHSVAVTNIKKSITGCMSLVGLLRSNYRLGLLLGMLRSTMDPSTGKDVGTWARSKDLARAFEGLFDPKAPKAYLKDASGLNFEVLANKGDLNASLIDLLMYDSDALMAKTLALMDSSFRQRQDVLRAVKDVLLLEHTNIPVYHDVHNLRNGLDELWELISTYAVWGVRSLISGDMDDVKFGSFMRTVDSLLEFIYTPTLSTGETGGERERSASLDREPSSLFIAPSLATDDGAAAVNKGVSCIVAALGKAFPGVPADMRVLKLFQTVDADCDGSLSFEELRNGMRLLLSISPEVLSDATLEMMQDEFVEEGETEVNASSFGSYLKAQTDGENYRGSFKDCEADAADAGGKWAGRPYTSVRMWSTDVAAKWLKTAQQGGSARPAPNQFHQEILRACNLPQLLDAALRFDPEIAFTGKAECTMAQKVESQRRITLMLRAMLVLLKAFCVDNPVNQAIVYEFFPTLQRVATPPELRRGGAQAPSASEPRPEPKHYACYTDGSGAALGGAAAPAAGAADRWASLGYPMPPLGSWPSTVQEMAQDAILAALRANEPLCLRLGENTSQRHPLFDLFAHAANQRGAAFVADAPALDFFFIAMSPTARRTLQESQGHAVAVMMDPSYPALRTAAATCVADAVRLSPGGGGGGGEGAWRMVRLLRTAVQQGNHWTLSVLQQGLPAAPLGGEGAGAGGGAGGFAGALDLDTACRALATIIGKRVGWPQGGGGDAGDDDLFGELEDSEREAQGAAILEALLSPILHATGPPPPQGAASKGKARPPPRTASGDKPPPPPQERLQAPRLSLAAAAAVRAGMDPVSACEEALAVANYAEPIGRSGPCDLLGLCVELVDLQPFSEAQAKSKALWGLAEALEPALGALSQRDSLTDAERVVLRDVVDL